MSTATFTKLPELTQVNPPIPGPHALPVSSQKRPWKRNSFRGQSAYPVFDTGHVTTADLMPPAKWAAQVARGAVECLSGARPPAQMVRWLVPEIYRALNLRVQILHHNQALAKTVSPSRIISSKVSPTKFSEDGIPTVLEACVIVFDGVRPRAVAMQVSLRRGRWVATALEIG
ncbi:MAG: Rv3235 family protein [Actinomycetaceae bacterium]|nr:Rv3235 family protein [Actinomycetaceae bacterium]